MKEFNFVVLKQIHDAFKIKERLRGTLTTESKEIGPSNPDLAQVSDPANKENKNGYNPAIAIPAILLDKLCISISRVGVEYMYAKYPEITVFQMLFYRAVIATAFSVV